MASDNLGPVQPQRIENGLSSRMMFPEEAIHFSRGGADDHAAPRKLAAAAAGFAIVGDRGRYGRSQYGSQNPSWNLDGRPRSDGSDGEDEDDDEDDVDDDDDLDEGDGLVSLVENNSMKNGNNSSGSVQSSSEKGNGEKAGNLQEHHSPFGSNRGIMVKDSNLSHQQQQQQHERVGNYENAITVVQPELHRTRIMNGGDGSSSCQKERRGENGHVFGARKEVEMLVDPGESLRRHLLDPVTGVLMDDAVILPVDILSEAVECSMFSECCSLKHSIRSQCLTDLDSPFGLNFQTDQIEYYLDLDKACCQCSQRISEDLVRPNLALRSAVQAFRREEESQSSKLSKRKRDRFEQEKCSYDDPYAMDSRGKGVQFPFVVSDRVIIKGNKRTPQRFVGRVAVVTTQCLNGWYVVKTLDNAESVKLQYRSLAKVPDDSPASNIVQSKAVVPSWL